MFAELAIDIDNASHNPSQVLDLALRYDLTSYDAVYLDLALRRGVPIATRGQGLGNAAMVGGVGVVEADR